MWEIPRELLGVWKGRSWGEAKTDGQVGRRGEKGLLGRKRIWAPSRTPRCSNTCGRLGWSASRLPGTR